MISFRRIRVTLDHTPQVDCVSDATLEMLNVKCSNHLTVAMCMKFLEDRPTEEFWVVALDGRHSSVGMYRVSTGTMSTTLVHPREVFAPALALGTVSALILVHNHPSGDPEPSAQDRALTTRIYEAGELLGISLLDHVVIGHAGRSVSMRTSSTWPPKD